MQDFRMVKESITNAVKALNVKDGYYNWRAKVMEQEVRIRWEFNNSVFVIVNSGNGFIEAKTGCNAFIDDRLVGMDGSLADCIESLINSIYRLADERM